MITDTILRDAHQSHAATRMRFDEMEEVLPLGSIEKSEKILKKDAHTDAFKGAEFTGLQTLRR